MPKLERKALAYFAGFTGTGTGTAPANVDWEVLGVDNDDLSKELNPDTETNKNVLGEATFKHNGYEPEVNVDPYYADSDSNLYTKLSAAAIQEKYGATDLVGYFVECTYTTISDTAMSGTGFMRQAWIVPQSTGGDTSGVGIPFTVHPFGPQTQVDVAYTVSSRAVAITAHT